jgi:hypothetical protein
MQYVHTDIQSQIGSRLFYSILSRAKKQKTFRWCRESLLEQPPPLQRWQVAGFVNRQAIACYKRVPSAWQSSDRG